MNSHQRFRWIPLVVSMVLFWMGGFSAHSQQLILDASVMQFDQITISDLDFQNFRSTRPYFTVSMTNNTGSAVSVALYILIDGTLADGTPLSPLAQATTLPFNLPSGITSFTNVDLSNHTLSSIKNIQFDPSSGINQNATDKIKGVVRSTGKPPAGMYEFKMWLQGSNLKSNVWTQIISVINPSRVELLSPMTETEWPNPFPVFQWSSNTDEIILAVYEKLPGTQSPQEAINGVPQLKQRLGKINTFQYPATGSGVRPLEAGKTYYWFVQGIVRSSGNTEDYISSEIWELTISNQSSQAMVAAVLQQLKGLLGGENQAIIDRLEQMGFQPTGLLKVGGIIMTWSEFLTRVQSGDYEITNVTIE